jgi:hypothetical protein
MGAHFIGVCRQTIKEKQYRKFEGILIDLYSASAVITVYDNLNETNKKKLEALEPKQIIAICFKLIK